MQRKKKNPRISKKTNNNDILILQYLANINKIQTKTRIITISLRDLLIIYSAGQVKKGIDVVL